MLHVSLAVTCVATLASVGRLLGLQPSVAPPGTVRVGGVVSAVQVKTTVAEVEFVQASVAVTVKVRVAVHPLVASECVMLVVTRLQASMAVTSVAILTSVGRLAGLHPRLAPFGTVRIGGVVSSLVEAYTTVLSVDLLQAPMTRTA